jgi:hypothetical protein
MWSLAAQPLKAQREQNFDRQPVKGNAMFSPDGRWLAAWGVDEVIQLWDLQKSSPFKHWQLKGHTSVVQFVEMIPDSFCLVSGSEDGTVRLWDLHDPDAKPVVLRGHQRPIMALTIDRDRRRLMTGDTDGNVRIWRLWESGGEPSKRLNALIDLASRLIGRNLSIQEWDNYFPGQDYRRTFPDLPVPKDL